MTDFRVTLAFALFVLVLSACGSGDDQPAPIQRLEAAGEVVPEAIQEAGTTIEPVDFRVLRDLLPESLSGLPRQSAGGERGGALGVKVSKATAKYHAPGAGSSKRVPVATVSITDLGGLERRSVMSFATWTSAEIDKETETGYERTTTYKGHPAYEKFSNFRSPAGEIEVLISARFFVEVQGQGMEMARLEAALDQLDLERLARFTDVQ